MVNSNIYFLLLDIVYTWCNYNMTYNLRFTLPVLKLTDLNLSIQVVCFNVVFNKLGMCFYIFNCLIGKYTITASIILTASGRASMRLFASALVSSLTVTALVKNTTVGLFMTSMLSALLCNISASHYRQVSSLTVIADGCYVSGTICYCNLGGVLFCPIFLVFGCCWDWNNFYPVRNMVLVFSGNLSTFLYYSWSEMYINNNIES